MSQTPSAVAPRVTSAITTAQAIRDAVLRAIPTRTPGTELRGMTWVRGIDWPVVLVMALYHIGAIAALFFFSWPAVIAAVIISWMTAGWGICLGYHRLLTHRSFETFPPIRWFVAFCGTLSSEGSPIWWVATHRKHHQFSDQEGDPHSPTHGFWWSHMLWLAPWRDKEQKRELVQKYAPDLLKDPVLVFLHHTHALWYLFLAGALFAIGYFGWGTVYMGLSFLLWGMFVRLVYSLHVTWAVNSATHVWGYRNYETTDDSRNLWWVGLLAFGEGWHNNHHAYPRMAPHGHNWWEFDITYITICLMEKLGLAWKVVHKSNHFDADKPKMAGDANTVLSDEDDADAKQADAKQAGDSE